MSLSNEPAKNIDLIPEIVSLSGSVPVSKAERHVNKVYYANARLPNEATIQVVYKVLGDPEEVLVEQLCALLGRALGLPIPAPYRLPVSHPQSTMLYISHRIKLMSLRRDLESAGAIEEILARLSRHEDLRSIVLFDEWVHNYDRHFGNILTGKGQLYFIDHGLAFQEGHGQNVALRDIVVPHYNQSQLQGLLADWEKTITERYWRINFSHLPEHLCFQNHYLTSRLEEVLNYLHRQMGLQQGYLPNFERTIPSVSNPPLI